jgi:hypothetical protein
MQEFRIVFHMIIFRQIVAASFIQLNTLWYEPQLQKEIQTVKGLF